MRTVRLVYYTSHYACHRPNYCISKHNINDITTAKNHYCVQKGSVYVHTDM